MNKNPIAIYGAGGLAREVAWLVSEPLETSSYSLVTYIDDADGIEDSRLDRAIVNFAEFQRQFTNTPVAIAVGNPKARQLLADRCSRANIRLPALVHTAVPKSNSVRIDAGCIVFPGCVLTANIELGEHVLMNPGCTIGHDVKIASFATLSPGVNVSGNVHIGHGAYIGTGASIINGTPDNPITIGNGCFIAAGACVTKSCAADTLYAGVPAIAKKHL